MTFTLPGIQTVASLIDPAVIAECGEVVYQIETTTLANTKTSNAGISIALADHTGLSSSDFVGIEITIDPASFELYKSPFYLYIRA